MNIRLKRLISVAEKQKKLLPYLQVILILGQFELNVKYYMAKSRSTCFIEVLQECVYICV